MEGPEHRVSPLRQTVNDFAEAIHPVPDTQVVANLIIGVGIIAALATALSGAFILPILAGEELRDSIGLTLLGVGKSLSGWVA